LLQAPVNITSYASFPKFALQNLAKMANGRVRPSSDGVVVVTDVMEKPSLDIRSYRVVRLANQLEALIIHDPETDKASAALDVNVGSFSDPKDMPGLAHAVEHMLFMGTKKVRQ
jgi:insulysin